MPTCEDDCTAALFPSSEHVPMERRKLLSLETDIILSRSVLALQSLVGICSVTAHSSAEPFLGDTKNGS